MGEGLTSPSRAVAAAIAAYVMVGMFFTFVLLAISYVVCAVQQSTTPNAIAVGAPSALAAPTFQRFAAGWSHVRQSV